jgi:hypothetical protein
MPLYLVETVSMFRMRYVVDCKEETHATDTVVTGDAGDGEILRELSQQHIDENVLSVRKISMPEYMEVFDKDNDYLKNWSKEQKRALITKVVYK